MFQTDRQSILTVSLLMFWNITQAYKHTRGWGGGQGAYVYMSVYFSGTLIEKQSVFVLYISSAKASCRRPIKDCFLASSLPGCLAPWLPGGLAPGRPETVPRDPPDPRMWLTGLAPGRPETIPRADPQDPGPGGRFLLFCLKEMTFFTGGGRGGPRPSPDSP